MKRVFPQAIASAVLPRMFEVGLREASTPTTVVHRGPATRRRAAMRRSGRHGRGARVALDGLT
jgi:hypothetical protein